MGRCLGLALNIGSAVVRDSTVQGVTPRSPESLKGRNSMNTCPNGASEDSIGIYVKSRCHWSGHLIKTKLGQGRYGRSNLQGP